MNLSGLKSGVGRAGGGSRGQFPGLFRLLEATCPVAHGCSFHLQARSLSCSLSVSLPRVTALVSALGAPGQCRIVFPSHGSRFNHVHKIPLPWQETRDVCFLSIREPCPVLPAAQCLKPAVP